MCGENPDTQTPDVASTVAGDFNLFRDYASQHMDETSPMLEENISKQQKLMEESLSRKLGPNWRNTTPGIQAVSEFERNANIQREEDRMNRMNSLVSNYSNLAGTALQPYLADKQYAHDLALTGMLSDAQKRSDLMGLLGNVGGMGLYSYLMGGKLSNLGSGKLLTGDVTGGGGIGTGVATTAATKAIPGVLGGALESSVPSLAASGSGSLASLAYPAYGSTALPGSLTGAAAESFGSSAIPGSSLGYQLPGASEQFAALYGAEPGATVGASTGLSGSAALGAIGAGILAAPLLGPSITSGMRSLGKAWGFGDKTAPAGGEYLQMLTGGPETEWTQNAQSQWNTYLANKEKGLTNYTPEQMVSNWIADVAFGPTQYDSKGIYSDPAIKDLASRILAGDVNYDQLGKEYSKIKSSSQYLWRDPTAH